LIAKKELAILGNLKLSAVQREIVTRAGMGHTAVEIGAALGLVPDTVATHIRRVRAAFRKALRKRGR
jgi:DNA-binding CsgD family transcriptional regulator